MKKKVLVVLLSLLSIAVLASCGTKDKESGKEKKDNNELIAWAWDPNFNIKALKVAEEHYQKEHPDFEIKVIENAQDDIVQKLNTTLSSGTTKGLPNIVLIEEYRVKSFLEAFPDSFFPLTDFFDASKFMSYKVEATSIDGVNYGLPFDTGVTGLYIRKDIIEEAGLELADFTDITWDDFITKGKIVKEKTGKAMISNDMNDFGIIRSMLQSSGAWLSEKDGKTPYFSGNEPLKVAFENYKELYDSGVMIVHNGWDGMLKNFNSGEVAAVIQGNWITPSIKAEVSQSGLWAVLPYPRQAAIEASVNASNLGGSSWYVINTDGKEAAAAFLAETFGENIDFYQDLITEVGAIGSYTEAVSGAAYKEGDEFFGGQKIYEDFLGWAIDIPEVNFGSNTYILEDILKPGMQEFLKGKPVDEVLSEAQKTADAQVK